MLLRAIVEEVIDSSKVRVRIPDYNKVENAVGATPTSELAIAVCCSTPGLRTTYSKGDVVFVGFERDNIGSPIVIGALASASDNRAVTEANLASVNVSVDAKLPLNTDVQGVGKEFWMYLKTIQEDVQIKLNQLSNEIQKIKTGNLTDISNSQNSES